MKELKDIVLKKGDRISLNEDVSTFCPVNDIRLGNFMLDTSQVVKIERPIQYETIYKAPKPILDQKEKKYLEAVIRPFRDRAKYIVMLMVVGCDNEFCIYIQLSDSCVNLPSFKSGTMYKGMELNKEYTLDELGLFKE